MTAPLDPLAGLSAETFLAAHWQRAPCVRRQALPTNLLGAISPEDLAAAARDGDVESRVMIGPDDAGRFRVEYGPLEVDVSDRSTPWTLLVNQMDLKNDAADTVLNAFDFVGRWRLEDLMVSYAVPGGSVGAHRDQYDVFLVQAVGRRRWQFESQPGEDAPRAGEHGYALVDAFAPDQDVVLEPGDWLYLPPGCAHHGVALDPCLTWSVGLRTPSGPELWAGFADYRLTHEAAPPRLADPHRSEGLAGAICAADIREVRQLLGGVTRFSDAELARWFGCLMTGQEPPEPAEEATGNTLQRQPGARTAWYADRDACWLFAAGEALEASPSDAQLLAGQRTLGRLDLEQLDQPALVEQLLDLGTFRWTD